MTNSHDNDHAPDLSVMEARQARRGRHALVILVVSLTLVVIVLAAVLAFNAGPFAGVNRENTAERNAAAQEISEPPPVAKQTP